MISFNVVCFDLASGETVITISGQGTSKEGAIQDALRTAVEKATGVFIYSSTEVENFRLIKDKVIATSKGYIKDYKITAEKKYENMFLLTIDATVDDDSIKSIFRSNLKSLTYDDVLKDYALVKQQMEKLKKSADLLQTISSKPTSEMYIIGYDGYEIKNIGINKADVVFKIKVWLNPYFWDTYKKVLEQISSGQNKQNSLQVCLYEPNKSLLSVFGDSINTECFNIHHDFESRVLKNRMAVFSVNLDGQMISSEPYTLYSVFLYRQRTPCPPVLNIERWRGTDTLCDCRRTDSCYCFYDYKTDRSEYGCIQDMTVEIPYVIDNPELIKKLPKAKVTLF